MSEYINLANGILISGEGDMGFVSKNVKVSKIKKANPGAACFDYNEWHGLTPIDFLFDMLCHHIHHGYELPVILRAFDEIAEYRELQDRIANMYPDDSPEGAPVKRSILAKINKKQVRIKPVRGGHALTIE